MRGSSATDTTRPERAARRSPSPIRKNAMTKLCSQNESVVVTPEQVSGAVPPTDYILGHTDREVRRLRLQADILRPVTERLLRGAGVRPGMRVLEVGCGAGDVSMLAADLVGPSGAVVGIDASREVVAVASGRARAAGCRQLTFEESPVESFAGAGCFDVVVGRYVLVHQVDPAAFLSRVAGLVRPGGVVAFHELNIDSGFRSLPAVPLWQQTGEWIRIAF